MATGGAPGSKYEDFRYTCTLCMESYQGRSPKILPCFHTFCLPCLSALEASVTTAAAEASRCEDETKDAKEDGGEDADGEGKGAGEEKESQAENVSVEGSARQGQGESGKIFLCPTCRTPVTIPEGGVIHLQTNFYLDHELNEGEASGPVLCGMCDEGHQQPATHTCRDCQSHMCRTCRRYHDKFMANHHVTSVSLGQPVTEKKEEEKKVLCMVHRDQVLCFHCQQCHVSICLHCKFSSHEGHDTVELSGAILQAKGEMTSLVTSAQQQIHIMQSSVRSVDRKERQLARYAQETTQQVHARFDQLLTWGQQSRDRLLDAVSRNENEYKGHLEGEKSALTFAIDRLSCLVSRALGRSSRNDPDVVVLRNELKAALLSEDKLDHPQQQAENEDTAWSWRYVHTNTSGLQLDDVQAFMGRLVEGRADDDDDVPRHVSLQDLADKLDRFMSDTTSMLSTVTEKDADLERKITSLSEETKKDELALNTLQEAVTDLKKSRDEPQRNLTSLQKSETDTKQAVESLKEKTGKVVSFFATGCNRDETKTRRPFVFNELHHNQGGGFDITTGKFTAAVPGTYTFSATVGSDKKEDGVVSWLCVNGLGYCQIRATYLSTGACSLCVRLKAGDVVCMKAESSSCDYNSCETTFTGALVQGEM